MVLNLNKLFRPPALVGFVMPLCRGGATNFPLILELGHPHTGASGEGNTSLSVLFGGRSAGHLETGTLTV